MPIGEQAYREYSLIQICQEIAEQIDQQRTLSQTATRWYNRLLDLFKIIDEGDSALQVPRYNGGLFHFRFNDDAEKQQHTDNWFLQQICLPDSVLAPALDKLARIAQDPIDYSFLGVRQLGSIYEGLLEYKVVIDDADIGTTHLENDKGERKATGSYYTPDYIVKYMVSHTLQPILIDRIIKFKNLMEQLEDIRQRVEDKQLSDANRRGLKRNIDRLKPQIISTLLDIRVCDPAMGSGHFLVEAVDFLTDHIAPVLTQFENNPIVEMLEQIRNEIVRNLANQGITIDPDSLKDEDLLHRIVMKRCIYGVDLNKMAVELAKVSLWLHSFTIGAPLSFLDHHLRWGNSLIGAMASKAAETLGRDVSDSAIQLNIFEGPFKGLLRAAEIMRGISSISDTTFSEVEQSESLFREFSNSAQPYKRLLDVYIAPHFGFKAATNTLKMHGAELLKVIKKKNDIKLSEHDSSVLTEAEKLFYEHRFFHWDLEFPEVFIDLPNASWKDDPGFDAVVGNPPYVSNWELTSYNSSLPKIFEGLYSEVAKGHWDLFVIFSYRALSLTKKRNGYHSFIVPSSFSVEKYGDSLRKFILDECKLAELVDFGKHLVFEDVSRQYVIYIISPESPVRNETQVVRFADGKFRPTIDIPQSLFYDFLNHSFRVNVNAAELALGAKINQQSISLAALCHINMGIVAHSKVGSPVKFKKKDVIKTVERKGYEKFVSSSDIFPFEVRWNNLFLDYESKREYFHRSRFPELFNSPKIMLRRVSGENNRIISSYDEQGFYSDHLVIQLLQWTDEVKELKIFGYQSAAEDAQSYSLKYINAIINSNLVTFYFSRFLATDTLQGSYTEVYPESVRSFPVRRINFEEASKTRTHEFNHLRKLLDESELEFDFSNLFSHLEYLSSHGGEHSIHDFLDYLASEIINVSLQKQKEVTGFLNWLAREIGCEIDNLSNKTAIKSFLGGHSHHKTTGDNSFLSTSDGCGEPHLAFNDLLEILRKNKKKLSIDPKKREFQESFEYEYQASLDKLLPLKIKLMRYDWLIDQVVYKLYCLTEEEIGIIEGKASQIGDIPSKESLKAEP
ncbi:MAG: Eco57I restriction-modification methylase domain-containing protein [Nodosilinea sp. WJT8-NPBG4]|nr:Eco57I restriction-modification methylase domain-containing protein [Nodosilinea sp. WJT8-NPBG4]